MCTKYAIIREYPSILTLVQGYQSKLSVTISIQRFLYACPFSLILFEILILFKNGCQCFVI